MIKICVVLIEIGVIFMKKFKIYGRFLFVFFLLYKWLYEYDVIYVMFDDLYIFFKKFLIVSMILLFCVLIKVINLFFVVSVSGFLF